LRRAVLFFASCATLFFIGLSQPAGVALPAETLQERAEK
jgi:hypothetical protein